MEYIFNKTVIGYSHIDRNIRCQDNSLSFQNEDKYIIATCDGHGGNVYIRSDLGSKFACLAIKEVFNSINFDLVNEENISNMSNLIKVKFISYWNSLVEQDFSMNPFKFYELENLSEKEKNRLENNYVTAYGTTINAVMITKKYIITFSLGDGGIFIINKDNNIKIIEDDDNVANITNSLCSEDVNKHLSVTFLEKDNQKVIFCVTDGVLNPYQSYENFNTSFIYPLLEDIQKDEVKAIKNIKQFIKKLGIETGIGDDVSIAMYFNKNNASLKENN